jgi:DNA-binding transcriptional LysR family regulator
MHINLNQLRAFYLAARKKSITNAAEALHVTQPAVTMQIKAFEKHLNVKLFRKYGKELQLTDVGQVLYRYAKRIFKIVDEVEYVLKSYGDSTLGSLTIGTTRSFARHLMPGLLSRFQKSFPKVRVFLKVGSSQEIADSIAAFKYDLGIIGRLPHMDKLKIVPYTKEEFCVVISPNHRLASKSMVSIFELKNEPIIIRESGSGSRHAILLLLASHNVKPSVLVEAGSVEFIKEYIINPPDRTETDTARQSLLRYGYGPVGQRYHSTGIRSHPAGGVGRSSLSVRTHDPCARCSASNYCLPNAAGLEKRSGFLDDSEGAGKGCRNMGWSEGNRGESKVWRLHHYDDTG